ncbi:MAG: glucose-1-phosphate thymidylyltransferase [Candidatus Magasanikbacteria bacterium]|jgi:glucose-1-phosphate thymidylyltransferase|nr:glucose-1-phosphate thymidylyltransferase [Candidatus Magasanikbacteria bacterium]MBT4221421.1 glucose-1-phosphate thymidylyltransferase [Candidatus Magasanikbacteria bacterium]MBT4350731.1 glucose-1-phosphate thymidylyltransferase [Candidatus Magasanikbacteria bacterium]MBT4541593.1 glucose-1-phosphate thymidylyltransferase [Candidatus Magasanikbacteria bacterium]MBT6252964.1 glucose-1-phosphate thymidylyltransferase [Candidatus Magasanikbacteria bacterium]
MKIRKAILTGGGRGTRLHPVTITINKHLLPLANKPMIFHAIEKAVEAGITDIFINVNPGETDLQTYIGDGGHWGINIEYFEQTGGPQGIAHVVKEAERFIGNDPFLYYLSDNVLLGGLKEFVTSFEEGDHHAMVALSEVEDSRRFGVPIFGDDGNLVDMVEKPQNPPNNFAVTGIYLFGPKFFFQAFDNIEKSARGEYEIPSIYSYLLKNGYRVGYKEITGWWKDTGKPKDLLLANKLLLENMETHEFPNHGSIVDDTVTLEGNVHIGIGSRIGPNATIKGPVIIGENCVLENCVIGPNVTVGRGTEIRRASIQDAIILENAFIDWDIAIENSIIGKAVRLVQRPAVHAQARQMIIGDKTVIEV